MTAACEWLKSKRDRVLTGEHFLTGERPTKGLHKGRCFVISFFLGGDGADFIALRMHDAYRHVFNTYIYIYIRISCGEDVQAT